MDYFTNEIGIVITAVIAGLLFYAFNEIEDACIRDRFDATRLWWNSKTSWKCKYAIPLQPYKRKWYHFGIEPKFEERFPFSTTVFVFLSDGEHLFQFLKFRAVDVGILLIAGWQVAAAWVVGGLVSRVVKEMGFSNYE